MEEVSLKCTIDKIDFYLITFVCAHSILRKCESVNSLMRNRQCEILTKIWTTKLPAIRYAKKHSVYM